MTETEVVVATKTRVCFSCRVEKSLEDFRRNRSKPEGREYMCKVCRRVHDAAQNLRPERRKSRHTENSRECNRQRSRQHYLDFPQAHRAKGMIARLVKLELIRRLPCGICGEEPADAHHPNYDFPLRIAWLCRRHHFQADRILRGSDEPMPLFFVCDYSGMQAAVAVG